MDLSRGQKLLVLGGVAALVLGVGVMSLLRLAAERREVAYLPTPDPLAAAPSAASVAIHVTGAVRQPGLYWLPQGSRVGEAIRLAGGFLPGADQASVNLAAPVEDGRQIRVSFRADTLAPVPVPAAVTAAPTPAAPLPSSPAAPSPPAPTATTTPVTRPTGPAPAYPVSLNQATIAQLEALPTIGPTLARRIVDYRTTHGGFRSVEELTEVEGIDVKRLAALRQYLRL